MSDNVLVQLTRKGLYLSALSEPNININLNYGTVVNFFFFILEINSVEGSYKCLHSWSYGTVFIYFYSGWETMDTVEPWEGLSKVNPSQKQTQPFQKKYL